MILAGLIVILVFYFFRDSPNWFLFILFTVVYLIALVIILILNDKWNEKKKIKAEQDSKKNFKHPKKPRPKEIEGS